MNKIKKSKREAELLENWREVVMVSKQLHAALVGVWATGYIQGEKFDVDGFAEIGRLTMQAGVIPFTDEEADGTPPV